MFFSMKRKDPICGMKEKKGTGIENEGKWFCNETCLNEFKNKKQKGDCCGCCH